MSESEQEELVLSSSLSPADADEERDQAVAAVKRAAESQKPLALSLDGDQLTPCAMQMLIAATRTAEIQGVKLSLSDGASAVMNDLSRT